MLKFVPTNRLLSVSSGQNKTFGVLSSLDMIWKWRNTFAPGDEFHRAAVRLRDSHGKNRLLSTLPYTKGEADLFQVVDALNPGCARLFAFHRTAEPTDKARRQQLPGRPTNLSE